MDKSTRIALALAMPTSLILIYWLYTKFSSSDEESYGRQRVMTTKHIFIEVTVPRKAVGAVIGRQGYNIKQIQEACGARLHFKDKPGEETPNEADRILIIHGAPGAAQQAELMVLQTIANVPEVLKEEIHVPLYSVGRIIGKGGATIKDVQRHSKCRIKIDSQDIGHDKDAKKMITLVGSRDQIDKAMEMIEEIVLEAQERKDGPREKSGAIEAQRRKEMEGKREMTNGVENGATQRWEKGNIKASAVPAEDDSWDAPSKALSAKPLSLTEGYFEVYVSAVEHPGHFWVQVIGMEALQLERLQNEMSQWLASEMARNDSALFKPTAGEMVAAKFEESDETYYRAKVLGILDDGRIDLYFVDYGDNAFVLPGTIYKLRPDFLSLSYQAVECHLANVEPIGDSWSDGGITKFEDLVYCAQWKSLVARVVTYTKDQGQGQTGGQDLRPSLQLFDTNGPKDIDINEELVINGFARRVKEKAANESVKSEPQETNASPVS